MKRPSLISILILNGLLSYAQHTLKNFTGNSDFGIADVIIQDGAVKGILKTKGTLSFDQASQTITLDNFTTTCSKNVVFDNQVIHVKGKVSIKANQITFKKDCSIDFSDSDAKLIIEYEQMDDASANKKMTISKLNYAQISITKKDTNCD